MFEQVLTWKRDDVGGDARSRKDLPIGMKFVETGAHARECLHVMGIAARKITEVKKRGKAAHHVGIDVSSDRREIDLLHVNRENMREGSKRKPSSRLWNRCPSIA